MSINGINACEDAEMADCDGEKVVTMMDVLKEQEDFEEDANAVLGASDDKNCTYSKGYIKRQAIYACMTCCADAKNDPTKWAGVCLACSLTCHENHELIELYTKRNFRCDCGNPKFNTHPCRLTPFKTELNVDNIYNQNFGGVYCICHRPYPDPDNVPQGDMIQCIICEDWLHSNHLDAVVPLNDQYSEMICKACMDKNEFLHDYSELAVHKDMDVDILNNSSEITTTAQSIENSNTVSANNEDIANVDSDDVVKNQIERDNVSEKLNNEHMTNDKLQNEVEPDSVDKESIEHTSDDLKEEQNSKENSDCDKTNEKQNEDNIELQNDKNNAEKNGNQADVSMAEDTNEKTHDDLNEKEIPQTETELQPTEKQENRSQEQLEEDLLLADPTENELEGKNDDVTSSSTKQTNKDESEKQSEPTLMEISEPDKENRTQKSEDKDDESSETATLEKSENVTATEEIDNMTPDEQTENVTTIEPRTEESEDCTVSDHITDKQQETAANSEYLEKDNESNTLQSETASNIEQPEVASTTEESHISSEDSDQSKDVAAKLEHITDTNNESADVPMDESVVDKDNPADIIEDENNAGKSGMTNNDSDKEISVNKVETDILKRKISTETDTDNVEVKKPKLEERKCIRPKGVKKVFHGATFWPSDFRHKLCTCNECITMYKDLSVLFLIDPEDTMTAYEALGKDITDGKPTSQYEKGMAALSSLGRVQQINAMTEFGKLRDKLLDFLKSFKERKVIVKEEDIKAFFAGMKPVREPDGVYFCR